MSLGFKTPAAFAKKLHIKYTTYLNYEKKRLPPSDVLSLIKNKYGHDVNIDRLFARMEEIETENTEYPQNTKQKPMIVRSENQTPYGAKRTTMSHADMVSLFKDKEWAIDMNEMLLDLERLDPNQKGLIKAHLAGMIMALEGVKKNRY